MHCESGNHITINGTNYDAPEGVVTGHWLKELAGIPDQDTLFLNVPGGDDAVIHNDIEIKLRPGSCLYSCPPAKYGDVATVVDQVEHDGPVQCLPQAKGWNFLLLEGVAVPTAYTPDRVKLLIKLPPGFPDAAPDMFWVDPHLRLSSGAAPKATSTENLLGTAWQRFSWHLQPGAWRPGTSTLQDFLNCVRARLLRGD